MVCHLYVRELPPYWRLNGGYRRVVRQDIGGTLHKDSQLIIATLVAKSSLVPAANRALVELVSTLLQTSERISKTRAIAVAQ